MRMDSDDQPGPSRCVLSPPSNQDVADLTPGHSADSSPQALDDNAQVATFPQIGSGTHPPDIASQNADASHEHSQIDTEEHAGPGTDPNLPHQI